MSSVEYMQRALALAEKGRGEKRTNPLVGAVIVKDGRIIAEGFHRAFGADHAEVDALQRAIEPAQGAALYVNLEPCAHFGKTPPCVEAIRQAGIARVIAAMTDPNPQVNGAGMQKLREAGIEVTLGVCEEEARRLNAPYLKYIRTGLPFVTLKIAQTLDGKIADNAGNSKWISSEASRRRVHELRVHHDAVLVGANTVRLDNPELTSHGLGRDPLRLVVAGHDGIGANAKIVAGALAERTILCTPKSGNAAQGETQNLWQIRGADGQVDLRELLLQAASNGVASILVEGGQSIFSQFIESKLVDKFLIVVAPKLLGDGLNSVQFVTERSIAAALNLEILNISLLDGDVWIEAFPRD